MIDYYFENVLNNLITSDAVDKEIITKSFSEKFQSFFEKISATKRWNTVCRLLAKKLVHENLSLRKKMVGEFMKSVRSISQQWIDDDTFEEGLHTVSSEPYFLDTSYKMTASREITVIDRKNRCLTTEARSVIDKNEFSLEGIIIAVDNDGKCYFKLEGGKVANPPKTWKCDFRCKAFCNEDKQNIMELKNHFTNGLVEEIRDILQNLDHDCQHGHYSKPFNVD